MIFEALILYLLFPLVLTLHNLEESLWLPKWTNSLKRKGKTMNEDAFIFANIVVTSLAYLITITYVFFPEITTFKYFYFGFLGIMMFNVIFPHLALTIEFKRYCPGLITGMLLLLPTNSFIIIYSINQEVISFLGLIMSTVLVGVISLILFPILFRMGKIFLKF